jgi:hypothetical protein
MKPGDPIIIEATANGWIVRSGSQNTLSSTHDMHCFQDLLYDPEGVCCGPDCVVGFMLKHFKKPA